MGSKRVQIVDKKLFVKNVNYFRENERNEFSDLQGYSV